MKLKDALLDIQYDASWGIWADLNESGQLNEDADARYGQKIFENGGLLDNKVLVCDGETIGDWLTRYGFASDKSDIGDDPYWIDAFLEEANEWVKDRFAYA